MWSRPFTESSSRAPPGALAVYPPTSRGPVAVAVAHISVAPPGPPVARRCGGRGKLAAAALDALRRVEESCPGAGAKIRRKVPAYR